MGELIVSWVKCEASFNTEMMDTVIGTIQGMKQFKVKAEIEYVSSGDFSQYQSLDSAQQKEFNEKLSCFVAEQLLSHSIKI